MALALCGLLGDDLFWEYALGVYVCGAFVVYQEKGLLLAGGGDMGAGICIISRR